MDKKFWITMVGTFVVFVLASIVSQGLANKVPAIKNFTKN